MSDYDDIMKLIMDGNIAGLEEASQVIADFPTGTDDFINRHWITNGIDSGGVAVVEWMLSKKPLIRFRDDEGYTPIHSALERDSPDKYEILSLLISAGADVDAHGVNDWTPAHMAAAQNDVKALKILREAGADFSIRTRIDDYATPLEEAASLGDSQPAVDYLKTQL